MGGATAAATLRRTAAALRLGLWTFEGIKAPGGLVKKSMLQRREGQ